jgi:acyl-coenzyme A thioesterase PaaI-like protein
MLTCIVPDTSSEAVRCVARYEAAGRQSAGAEAELHQGDRRIARAISTHTIVEQRAA